MCGIAGVLDLAGLRMVPEGIVQRMAQALVHRGPDEEGYLQRPGLALASRRLSIVGLADGQQPVANEDRSVFVVFNGELFDYPERRAELTGRGHRLVTHCDTEIIPHLWEENQEGMFERMRGQFAVALWDVHRHQLTLGRDRFGICPFTGRDKGTGSCSHPKSRAFWPRAWCRPNPTCAALITCLPLPPCRGRLRVLKVCLSLIHISEPTRL